MSSGVGGNRYVATPSVNTTVAHAADELYWGPVTRGLLSATLLAVMIASVVGNTLVMVIIVRNKGMRTRTNLLLFNLALTDLLASLLDMPVSLVTAIRAEWIFPVWMCMFNGFTTPLFIVASIHTLMYMSIHKFCTVRNPHSQALTKRRILVMNAAAWCWGIIAAALTISGLTAVNHFRYTTECSPKRPDDVKSYVHMSMAIVTCYAVPAIIILVCSIGVWTTIKSYGKRMRETSTVDERELYSQQQHIAVTLFLVVITFGVCWTPVVIYAIYAVSTTTEVEHHLAHPIVSWLGYLNSACNPIIYAFRSEAFREGYKQVILRKKPGRRSSTSTATLSGGTASSFNQYARNRINRSSTQSTAGADVSRSSSYFAALMAPDRDTTATTLSTMLYDDDGNAVRQIPYSIEMTRLDRSSSARGMSPSTTYAESQSPTAEKLGVSFSDNEELAEHLMAADSSVSSAAAPLVGGEPGTPATSRTPIPPKSTLKSYLSVERLDNIDSDSQHSHHRHGHRHRGHGGSDNDSANHGRHRRGGHHLGGLFHRATSDTPPEAAADVELAGNEASQPPSRQTSHNINSLQHQQRAQHVGTAPSSRQQHAPAVNAAQLPPEASDRDARRPIYIDRTSANSSSGRGSGSRATDGQSRSSAISAAPATRELSSRSRNEAAEIARRQQPSSQTRSARSVGTASADGQISHAISQQQQPAAAAMPKPQQKLRPGTVGSDGAGATSPLGGNPTAAAGHVTVHGTVGNGRGDQRPKPASSGRRSGTPNAANVSYDSRVTEI